MDTRAPSAHAAETYSCRHGRCRRSASVLLWQAELSLSADEPSEASASQAAHRCKPVGLRSKHVCPVAGCAGVGCGGRGHRCQPPTLQHRQRRGGRFVAGGGALAPRTPRAAGETLTFLTMSRDLFPFVVNMIHHLSSFTTVADGLGWHCG